MKKWLRRMETSTSKEFCLSDKRAEEFLSDNADINFLKQKKIEVDKEIVVGCKCSYCMNGKELSKALSLGIEVCENMLSDLKQKWIEKCKRMEIMSGDVAIFELNCLIEQLKGEKLL